MYYLFFKKKKVAFFFLNIFLGKVKESRCIHADGEKGDAVALREHQSPSGVKKVAIWEAGPAWGARTQQG